MSDARQGPEAARRIESWKEIAAYLRRDVRTVQRWEMREGLPVHRHVHGERSTVYAFAAELDAWTASRQPAEPDKVASHHAWLGLGGERSLAAPPSHDLRSFASRWSARRFLPIVCVLAATVGFSWFTWTRRTPATARAPTHVVTRLFAHLSSGGQAPRIPLGPAPTDLVLTPDGSEAYVSDVALDAVWVIDTARRVVTHKIHVPGRPSRLDVSPDGRTVLVARLANTLAAIRTRDKKVSQFATGTPTQDVQVTADGRHAYVAMQYSGLERVDVASGVVTRVPIVGCPMFLALDPPRGRLFLSYQCEGPAGRPGHDAVDIMQVPSGRKVATATGPPQVGGPVAVSPDGTFLWVNGHNACEAAAYDHAGCPSTPAVIVNVFRADDGSLVRSLAFGSGDDPGDVGFLPGGRYVVLSGTTAIARVIDAMRFSVSESYPQPMAAAPRAMPGGTRAWAVLGGAATELRLTSDAEDVPEGGLLHHWRADGTADDAWDGMHGVLQGKVGYAPGVMGRAFSLDGDGSHVSMVPRPTVRWPGDGTIALWARFNSIHGEMALLDATSETAPYGWRVSKDNDNRIVFSGHGNDTASRSHGISTRLVSRTQVEPGRWYHVAVIRRTGVFELLVDGQSEATLAGAAADIHNGSLRQTLGRDAGGHFLDGQLDEIVVYDRALGRGDIARLARTGRGPTAP